VTNETAILDEAKQIVNERESANGPAIQSMTTIRQLWNVYLGEAYPDITTRQAAVMLALLKVGRHTHGDNGIDDARDIAGYAELAARVEEESDHTCCDCCINDETGPVNKF